LLTPEDLPVSDDPAVGTEACEELMDTAWSGSLPHGADEDDDDAEMNLRTEEAYRRWGDSPPAALAIAAEAQSLSIKADKLLS
jgi:hypothetical protein